MIAIVDYGAGNLASVVKAFRALGAEPRVARTPAELQGTAGIVIPGVGHFGATRALDEHWRRALLDAVRGFGATSPVPLLGVCLGMQWLYEGSAEAPDLPGLGVFTGRITRITGSVKIPHVGWNTLRHVRRSPLVGGIDDDAAVYFTHAYAAPVTDATIATSEHGVEFAAIVQHGTVAGMQFHPEKSGTVGLRLLRNWLADLSAAAPADLKARVADAL